MDDEQPFIVPQRMKPRSVMETRCRNRNSRSSSGVRFGTSRDRFGHGALNLNPRNAERVLEHYMR